jgi:hypothetical protein
MNPDRFREIKKRWAEIDRELADLQAAKVVSSPDPAAREAELLEGQDALDYEMGDVAFRNRRAGGSILG